MVTLRSYPYPFKAAFSFSNDIDLTTPERYIFIRDLFQNFPPSAADASPGLPYAESVFWINRNPFHPEQVSLDSHPDLLLPDLESGYLGILHSWGDFNFNPVFKREDAVSGFEVLSNLSAHPRVWVNHGTLHNLQNVGAGMGYGDAREYIDGAGIRYNLPGYHLDLLCRLGVDYFWISGLEKVVGQNAPLTARKYWHAYYDEMDSVVVGGLRGMSLRAVKRYAYIPWKVRRIDNRLLSVRQMRDGTRIFEFKRFGAFDKATADDLMDVIPPKVIDTLVRSEGTMVFMTHLGKTKVGAGSMTESAMKVLRHLKRNLDIGLLWVASLPRLLEYHMLLESICFDYRDGTIAILSFENPVKGVFVPSESSLDGLTFYCRSPENTRVVWGERRLNTVANPPDHTGKASLTVRGENRPCR